MGNPRPRHLVWFSATDLLEVHAFQPHPGVHDPAAQDLRALLPATEPFDTRVPEPERLLQLDPLGLPVRAHPAAKRRPNAEELDYERTEG